MKKHLLLNQLFGTEGGPNQTGKTLTPREFAERTQNSSKPRRPREVQSLYSGCSAVDVPMTSYGASDEHPMSIRSASDGTRWNSRGWKYVAMIFAVLTLSIANVGMAWGTDFDMTIDKIYSLPTKSALITLTSSSNCGVSSGALSIANGKIGTFTISSNVSSTYKIRSIAFTVGRNVSGFTCTSGGTLSGSNKSWTFTPTSNTPVASASFSLNNTSGGAANITFVVTMTTAEALTVEELYNFTGPAASVYGFTSSAATTQIASITDTGSDAASASSNLLQFGKSSSKTYAINIAAKTGYTLKFVSFYFYDKDSDPSKITSSVTTFTSSTNTWIGSSSATNVTFTCTKPSSNPVKIQKIYVGYEAAAAKDYTVTAATSTGDNTYGTVAASASSLDEGEMTTITATPATGYQVTNWAVSGTGASITPSGASNATSTTLTMGSENATVTASFGPKSYTVILDNQSATSAGMENVTTTYNSNTNLTSAITKPTKDGKVFAGYFTAANGGGVQLIDPAGNWIASAGGNSTYMDGSKNWKYDNNLTLYACWMEYCPGMDMAAEAIRLGSGEHKTWTNLTTNKILYSLSGNTAFDDSSDASNAYDGLKFKNNGDYILFLVQANSSLKLYFGYTDTKPKISINGGAESTVDVGSTGSKTPNQEVDFGTETYDRLIKLRTVTDNSVVLQKIDITPSCTAPNHVDVTGTWHIWKGGNMELTATAYSSEGTGSPIAAANITGYQWYKGGTEEGNIIAGATSSTYSKSGVVFEDAGNYYCKITTGDGCATMSSPLGVKMYRIYFRTGKDSGSEYGYIDPEDLNNGNYEAQATIRLASANYTYGFGISDGVDNWFYNTGTMDSNNNTDWAMTPIGGTSSCGLTSTLVATYTVTLKYGSLYDYEKYGSDLKVSVTYPSDDQAAGKIIYFDNSQVKWSNLHYRVGQTGNTVVHAMSAVPGTANLWKVTTTNYGDLKAWHIGNNCGWSGSHSIYYTNTDDGYAITKSIEFDGGAVTDAAVTIFPRTDGAYKGSEGQNSNCDFHYYTLKKFLVTHTATVGSTTNGSIELDWTDISGADQTATSTTSGLAHTCNLQITAVPATGYEIATLTVNGENFTSGSTHVLSADATIAATFSLADYTITHGAASNGSYTIKVGDAGAVNTNTTANYGQTITLAATPNTGYALSAWNVTKTSGGAAVVMVTENTFAMPAEAVTISPVFAAIPVSSITLNKTSTTLTYGGSPETLSVTGVLPANALNKTYTWSSSNTGVATVTSDGAVSPVAPGSCNIYATANDGSGVKGTCAVTVNKANITPTLSYASVGGTTLTVGATSSGSPTITGNTGNGGVTYSSSNTSVATVSSTGVVTAVAAGSATITATIAATTNYNGNTATATFTIEAADDDCDDPQTVVKTVLASNTAGTTTGYNDDEFAGDPAINLPNKKDDSNGYKLGSGGHYFYVKLKSGTFVAGDKIKVEVTTINDAYKVNSVAQTILDLYFYDGSSTHTLLHTISDVTAAGTYTYTLTAADITTLNNKAYIGVYRPSEGRTQNPFIKSIEVEGCRDWTVDETAPTFVSSDPANGDDDVATSGNITLTFSENVTIVDASKFSLSGGTGTLNTASASASGAVVTIPYSGLANSTVYTLATAVGAVEDAAGNDNAAPSSISFTTEAAGACPTAASGEVVYKFVTKSSGLGTSAICANKDQDYSLTTGSGNPLETLTNGTLTARASSAATTQLKYNTSSINLNGGSNGWLIIGLDCPIQSGDVIRYVNSNSGSVAIRTAKSSDANQIVLAGNSTTEVQTVVISSAQATAFNELTTVYMVRKSGTSDISYFEIIRPYVVTLDANTNGGKVNGENTEVHYMLSGESLVLPHATKSGYRFKGWFTTSDGATQASTNYSPTGSTTLYAQFEDCPGSGTVYKWEVATELTNGSLPVGVSGEAEMEANEGNYLSTLIGGTLTLHNKNDHIKISDKSKFSIDDNAPYIIVNLDCALEAGDKFVATVGSHTAYVTKTSTRASTVELPTGTKQETAVPATLEGAKTLYIWRGSGNYKISYFEITRAGGSTYTVTYDGNGGSGTAPTDATAYARNAEVTVKDNTGSLTKSNYDALAYWNTKDDGTGTDYAISTGTFEITADVTLYAKWTQAVTLNANTANHGSVDGSATAVWNAKALTGITHATPVSGYKLLGYYTTASGDGVKVLNSDGSFASSNVADYITSGKWSRTGAAPTLYARYESSGALIWNLGVNTEATSLTTSSKNSEFAQIAGSNMTNAALTGISYSQSKKSELTGVIETPTSYDGAKYVSVTFQVAAGYKFTPSSVNVKVQPKDNAKTVKIELSDASSHSQNYTSDSQSAGSIHTVTMTGNGTFYTGTVTLKIYCYGASGGYRLGTPITIEGAVEATCVMPSFTGLDYDQTSYNLDDDASAITVTNPANVTTYAWKQSTTNDRSGTTPASGTNNTASYTPPTSEEGTMYYWCELISKCGTVKTPSVGITVSATKSDATISWTGTSASANYGGGGYTVKATVNETGWNGKAADLTLSAPAGIRIYNIVSGTADDSKKYVQASFDVTTAFDRETYSSTIPFTVSADATATYNAISDEEDVTFDACTGGGGSSEEYMPVDAAHIDNTTWKGGWVYSGIGMMRYSHGGSAVDDGNVKSLAHNMGAGNVITKYYKSSANHFGFYTEKAINGVRLYVYTSNDKSTVSGVYIANSAYASGTPSTGAVTYEATYYNDDDGLLGATNDGCTWVEIMFDSEVAAGKYGQINLSKNVNIAGIAFISSSGSGAELNTHLQWSPTLADRATVSKSTNDAYFTYSASKITENTNTLGAITYSSSNTSVATVDATGKVAMVAAGSTTIKATLAASGCYKKAEISYTLNVTVPKCTIAAGTLTLTSGTESKCSGDNVTLTLTGFESGASIQWKDGDTDINDDGDNYAIATDVTTRTSTLTTNQEGTYSVIVTKDCFVRSNRITISNKSAEASAEKIVDSWYVKNGRLTPDIALWTLSEGATFGSVAFARADEGDATAIGLSNSDCYAQDGIVYLKGKAPSSNDTGADIEYTLTLTVNDACGGSHIEDTKTITLIHQKNTDKHVLAFVVNGTAKGGFTDGITAAQTTSVGLYNAIAAQFDVLATNIYATDDEKKLKEYYSQYDILCITDYPNTQTKGANSKSYVDAIGALIDIRPILTMEAFVSKLANWKAKGISGNPKSPTTRQYTMDLQCKDHEIFTGTDLTKVGEGDEAMYRVSMVDNTKEDYATLDATYGATLPHKEKESKSGAGDGEYNYGGKPALQGFTFTQEMSNNDLLPIGLIDDGAGNPLQVGIERQRNMEARLMVLGINSYAMERLTDDGERVVINALNYLMKKNAEDISDCSTSFVGGAEGDTKNWDNANNWTGNTIPLSSQKVRILADCEVSSTVYAQSVLIVTDGKYNHGSDNAKGKLTIKENGALIVGGKIQAASAPAYNRTRATTPDKFLIETSDEHQAALIFDNEEAETQATVNLYSLGRKPSSYQYQYFAVPMEVVPVNPAFANETHGGTGIYTYVYSEATSGWTRRRYYDDLFAFEGLGITTKSTGAMNYTMTGNLASTATKEITLTHADKGLNLIGNSWMAPIQIGALAEDNTDAKITKTVYIYCAGRDAVKGAATSGVTETPGQWIAIPFSAAEFPTWKATGKLSVIPAMQAFEIKVSAEATLTLDYKKVVRGSTNDLNAKLRAPGRRMAANEVTMTNIRVSDSKTHTDLSLFEGDRFSEAFDNGWEAEYMNGDGRSAKLYAETETGKMAVVAMEDYEGTLVGFKPGKETEYTFSFMGDDNGYYLNDIKLQQSVRISEGETYTFTYEEGDAANRFYISRTAINAPEVATGMENLDAAAPRVQKIIYNDKLYIIRGGRLYDATGKVVK